MDRYRVKAPYVLAKTMTQSGPQVKGLYEGALVPGDASADWVERHLRKGLIEKLPAAAPAPEPEPEQDSGDNEEGHPAPQAPPESGPGSGHKAWIEYAVARGMSRDEATASSRDDLIAALREG